MLHSLRTEWYSMNCALCFSLQTICLNKKKKYFDEPSFGEKHTKKQQTKTKETSCLYCRDYQRQTNAKLKEILVLILESNLGSIHIKVFKNVLILGYHTGDLFHIHKRTVQSFRLKTVALKSRRRRTVNNKAFHAQVSCWNPSQMSKATIS